MITQKWPIYTDANGNYAFALPIKSIRQDVDGNAYASFDGAHNDQFISSQFMSIFRPVAGGYLFFSQSGELLYQKKADFEAAYTQQVLGLQIGTTGATAMAGNKTPTTTQRGGVLQQAAEANIPAQTVTDIATAQTAINTIVTKVNSVLGKLKAGGELA